MGNYSVSESIRKMKPQGTVVKKIKNGYYMYNYTAQQVVVEDEHGNRHRKTKTVMGEYIGSITEKDGYIPNTGHISNSIITGRNCGNYAVVLKHSSDTYSKLCSIFHPNDAKQIYSAAVIFFVEGFTYMTAMKGEYQLSYLPLVYDNVHMGYDALHTLCTNLGTRNTKIRKFESMLIDNSSKQIAIDGHVITRTSEHNDLSEFEYKASKLGSEHRWLTAYDVVALDAYTESALRLTPGGALLRFSLRAKSGRCPDCGRCRS